MQHIAAPYSGSSARDFWSLTYTYCKILQDLRRVAIEELKKVESSLDKESSEDAELRDKYGSRWNRPASAALNSSMREKIAGYQANLTAAGDSDARLEQRLMQNNAAFSALSIDAAVAQMPRLQVGSCCCAFVFLVALSKLVSGILGSLDRSI